jgi:polyisoprenoid-binding protein YceI
MNKDSSHAVAAIPGYKTGTWEVDPAHSDISFFVRQLLITTVRGRFTRYDVTIVTSEDPLGSSVDATIELASIDTGNEKRDEHIRSATFLDVTKHPTASYRSTGIRRGGEGWFIDGDLTLHGITRTVPLAVTVTKFGLGLNGRRRAGFSVTAQIDRGEFGIGRYSGGGLMVSDKVPISLEILAIRR